MGADSFRTTVAIADVNAAFNEALQNARAEHGNRGYTGSILEKNTFKVLTRTPMSEAAAFAYADHLFDTGNMLDSRQGHFVNDKFAAAGAVAITDKADDLREVTRTVTLTPRGGFSQSDLRKIASTPYTAQSLQAVKDAITPREREQWLTTSISNPVVTYGTATVTPGKGKRVTQYAIKDGDRTIGWGSTQAEARAKAVEFVSAPRDRFQRPATTLTIQPVVNLDSGDALLTISPKITKITLNVTAHLWTPGDPTSRVLGWLFFGTAPC